MRIKPLSVLVLSALLIGLATPAFLAPPPVTPLGPAKPVQLKVMALLNVYGIARPDKIFVTWAADENAASYKVFRDGQTTPVKVAKPFTPIAQSFTPEEWTEIKKALGISQPGQFFNTGVYKYTARGEIRQVLSQFYASVAVVMGLGYLDANVKPGEKHSYEIKKVVNGQDDFLGSIELAAKDYSTDLVMPAPTQCLVLQGDQRLDLYWPKSNRIAGYDIYRNNGPAKLNDLPVAMVKPKPDPDAKPQAQGMNLIQINKALLGQGAELMHFFADQTNSVTKNVLKNGLTYQYKIVPRDMLGPSTKNLTLSGTPQDLLPPAKPDPLTIEVLANGAWTLPAAKTTGCCATCPLCQPNWTPPAPGTQYSFNNGLRISWQPVQVNEEGLPEEVASYMVYRYNAQAAAATDKDGGGGILVGTVNVPANPLQKCATAVDDQAARPGIVYYYRAFVADKAGHQVGSGIFPASFTDNKPPLAPDHAHKESADEQTITIFWDPSPDPDKDLAGYRIYRRVCGTGPIEVPYNAPGPKTGASSQLTHADDQFRLVGMVGKNVTSFTDKAAKQGGSIPDASPLCYEYCVRAFDLGQNTSLDTRGNITCGRLKDTKGPTAPTIIALKARGNSIRIEWAAPPTPDLFSFRVYRSVDKTQWQQISIEPTFPSDIKCEDTPPEGRDFALGLTPDMYEGTDDKGQPLNNTYWLEDKNDVKPNTKYYYRVVSVDYLKNPATGKESGSASTVMSTFTYDKFVTDAPKLNPAIFDPQKGVVLTWTAPSMQGITYIVYRSSKSQTDGFLPLAADLTKNGYADATARPGIQYWYKVQYGVTASGHYSNFSNAVICTPPAP